MRILLLVPAIVWLLISGLLNAASEYVSKHWGVQPRWYLILIIAFLSAASSITWLPALLHKNQISIMGTGWLLIATITTLFIGLVFFGEQVSITQTVGMVLAVVALILLII